MAAARSSSLQPTFTSGPALIPRCRKLNCARHTTHAVSNQQSPDNFGESIMKVAKKIQGALPIIGLVSRLTSPEGGFDDANTYPEYCRGIFDKAPRSMSVAMQELEKKYGKPAASRFVLLMLWMSSTGLGLVQGKDIVQAARRLRVTSDLEVEVDRFEIGCAETRKKFSMMAPPEAPAKDKATAAVDAICTLCLGLKDGEAPAPDDAGRLVDIVVGALPAAGREVVTAAVAARPQRAGAYL